MGLSSCHSMFFLQLFHWLLQKKKGISGHDCGPTCGSVFVLCMRLCHVALLKLSNYSMTAKYWANGGTPKSSILIYGIFHDKLTILGYLHLWKPPHVPFSQPVSSLCFANLSWLAGNFPVYRLFFLLSNLPFQKRALWKKEMTLPGWNCIDRSLC